MIKAKKLFEYAHRVELDLAKLYHDMMETFEHGSEEHKFFRNMSEQEKMHSLWVDEMEENVDPEFVFETIDEKGFSTIFDIIEDVHDEVVYRKVDLNAALEIIYHLETSSADDFYSQLPENTPGLPEEQRRRMIRSCVDHAKAVVMFKNKICAAK